MCPLFQLLLICSVLVSVTAMKPTKGFYARGITGTYVPLSNTSVTASALAGKACPPSVSMQVYAYHTGMRIAPGEFFDPSGTCPTANGTEPASITMETIYSNKTGGRSYTAALSPEVLQCPSEIKTSFSSLRLTSVADLAIPIVKSTLQHIGVSLAFVDHMFGGTPSPALSRNLWYQKHGVQRQQNVSKILNKLSKAYEMVLNRSENLGAELASLNPAAPSCSYVGGASSRGEVERNLSSLARSLRPLWTRLEQSPPEVESKPHFLTDSRCKATLAGYKMESIKVEYKRPGKLIRGVYGPALSAPVSVGDAKCATLQVHRFSAAEAELSKSLTGRLSAILAGRILPFLVESIPAHEYGSEDLNRFGKEFPAFERQLSLLRAKSALLVGRLDKSNCRDAGREEPIDILIVSKPTSLFYCSKFAEADLSLSHPCYESTVMNTYGLQRGGSASADGSTMFVVAGSGTKQCVFDNSQEAAGRFREAIALAFATPTPEPSMEAIPEETAEPGDDPVTVEPTSGKACFPAEAEVTLQSGRRVEMQYLRIGDEVEVAPGKFSPVLFFSHATNRARTRMVVIETSSAVIAMSGTHLVPVGGELKPASELRRGDFVWATKNGALIRESILHMHKHTMRGLYNPHTREGSLLVNFGGGSGHVLASSYTTALDPAAAHAALMPLRWIHHFFDVSSPLPSSLLPETFMEGCTDEEALCMAPTELHRLSSMYLHNVLLTLAHVLMLAVLARRYSSLSRLELEKDDFFSEV